MDPVRYHDESCIILSMDIWLAFAFSCNIGNQGFFWIEEGAQIKDNLASLSFIGCVEDLHVIQVSCFTQGDKTDLKLNKLKMKV